MLFLKGRGPSLAFCLAGCHYSMGTYQTFTIRFIGKLGIFLSPEKRSRTFSHTVKGMPSIKDTVEALGVPHPEIDCLVVNGRPVDFAYQIKGGEKIRVYPDGTKVKSAGVKRLRGRYSSRPKFILDVHLGKLARHLRLLGFDTLYQSDLTDRQIVECVKKGKRIVLTRDIGLLKNKAIQYGYFVRTTDAIAGLKEIVKRYRLRGCAQPFTLCLNCNGKIVRTAKTKVLAQLPPETKKYYTAFYRCRSCGKVYWKGAHYRRLSAIIRHAYRSPE